MKSIYTSLNYQKMMYEKQLSEKKENCKVLKMRNKIL